MKRHLSVRLADLARTKEILQQKYPQVPIDSLAESLPEQALEWAAKSMASGHGRWPEDASRFKTAWNAYLDPKNRSNQKFIETLKRANAQHKNPLNFTLHDIEDAIESVKPHGSKRQVRLQQKAEGAELIKQKDGWRLYKVTTPEAACYYSKNTKWCTSDANTASRYLKDGPLYIAVDPQGKKYQFHLETNQYMDAADREIDTRLFWQFFTEEEIATNPKLSYLYAVNVLEGSFPAGEPSIAQNAEYSSNYAVLIGKPFPAGEPAIAQDAHYSYTYAVTALRHKPFPAGEPAIAQNAEYSYRYADSLLEGPFPAGEPAIAQSAQYSYLYAVNVLDGPFPAGEPAIAQNAEYSSKYAEDALKGKPFPAGEPAIAQSAEYSYKYAVTALRHKPFPAGEPAIAQSAQYSFFYASYVLKRRFPAGEPAIAQSFYYDYNYLKKFPEARADIENLASRRARLSTQLLMEMP